MRKRSPIGIPSTALHFAILSAGPAPAHDLPIIHFEPSVADKVAHAPTFTLKAIDCKPKKTKGHNFAQSLHRAAQTAGKLALGTTYIAGRGLQGAANGYNNYNRNNSMGTINTMGTNGAHSFSYNTVGNLTTVMQTY